MDHEKARAAIVQSLDEFRAASQKRNDAAFKQIEEIAGKDVSEYCLMEYLQNSYFSQTGIVARSVSATTKHEYVVTSTVKATNAIKERFNRAQAASIRFALRLMIDDAGKSVRVMRIMEDLINSNDEALNDAVLSAFTSVLDAK
jgi:hypothetical protein